MVKLKALRGAIGSYGRVAAGGIIEVDESVAAELLKTARFVRATEQDIAAAQKAQEAALALPASGSGAAFMPMPEAALSTDRLTHLIKRGEISVDDAKRLEQMEANLSARELDVDRRAEQLLLQGQELVVREAALEKREAALAAATQEFEERDDRAHASGAGGKDTAAKPEAAAKSKGPAK